MLDARTAELGGYGVGDTVRLVTSTEQAEIEATLVGTATFGESASLAGATLALFETATAQRLLLDGADAYSTITIAARDGISQEQLRSEVEAVIPDGLEVKTGAETSNETSDGLREALSFFTTFLLVFAAVALFVGTFLILNTFSILVAQRSQEMALYRALGAGRRQVTRSVLVEASWWACSVRRWVSRSACSSPTCSSSPSGRSASTSARAGWWSNRRRSPSPTASALR